MNYLEKRFYNFEEKARKKHGQTFVYNKETYVDQHTEMEMYCTKHNIHFQQSPSAHLNGCGCKSCAIEHKKPKKRFKNTSEFVSAMIDSFGIGTFTYEKTEYVDMTTPLTVTCPKHGDIIKTPDAFLNSHKGCWKCGREVTGQKKLSNIEEFKKKSIAKFGNKFDFSESKYIKAILPMDFVCPIHGKVTMTPHEHLRSGTGCPECGKEKKAQKQYLTPEQIISLGKQRYGDKYTYLTDTYRGYQEPMDIICPIHGKFSQPLDSHLHNNGCPKCNNRESTGEKKIYEHLCKILGENNVYRNYVGLYDDKREIDVYIPSLGLGVEFDGLRWHSKRDKNYHLKKTIDALEKGIYLIHIFEDEWVYNEDLVLAKLASFVKKINAEKIGGRKCTIKEITKNEAEAFLNTYHLQHYAHSTVRLGAFYGDKLISVMSFIKEGDNWELNRFATDYHYILPGLASKMFNYFTQHFQYNEIKSFLDRRWVHNKTNMYDKLGFELAETLKPDYKYVCRHDRIHKFNCRKQILSKKYGFPLTMTESEMTKELGYEKIWDCGLFKYIYKNKK